MLQIDPEIAASANQQPEQRAASNSNNNQAALACTESQEEGAVTTAGNRPNSSNKSIPAQSVGEEEEELERDTATGGESGRDTDEGMKMKENDAYGIVLTGRRTSSYENVVEIIRKY